MTRVSWGRQLALAGALFSLGSFAYWMEYTRKPQKEAKEEAEKKLFRVKDIPVQSVRVTDGIRNFDMTCADFDKKLCKAGDNSKWDLVEPRKIKADDSNVNSLISSISQLNVTDTIDLKDETPEKRAALLKEYGLDSGARAQATTKKVFIRTGTGETVVYLGVTHPIGDGIFAVAEEVPAGQKPSGKIDEKKVYLVPSYFKSNLEHDLTYWRDKKLLSLGSHDVESFTLDGTKAYVIGLRQEGNWLLRAGQSKTEDLAGDIENIDSMLTSAVYLTAKDFVADDKNDEKAKAALKGTKPIMKLTLKKEKAPGPIILTFFQKPAAAKAKDPKATAAAPGKLYVTVSNLDPLFELEAYAKDRLDKDLKELRLSKLITSMERFGAKRVEVAGDAIGTPPLVLVNANGKWINDGDKAEVNNEKVQNLLDKLSGNRIKDFVVGPAIPAGEQKGVKVTLGDEKNKAKREYVFWKAADKLYGRDLLANRKEALVVDVTLQSELPWARDFFKKSAEPPSAPAAPAPPSLGAKK